MIPDAVVAAVQATVDANPDTDRAALGRLIVAELRRDGWQVVAPGVGRSSKTAVDGPSNSAH
ncbi:hypothetical protein [Kitasatospora mediocidica]|uniref:hypothetical protein n=1 Tax=Kitasatospora mediocidica TaxID=58352 RepID=UPI0005609FD9|nr:hypothetical protein [Kitasatospora mediocidica]